MNAFCLVQLALFVVEKVSLSYRINFDWRQSLSALSLTEQSSAVLYSVAMYAYTCEVLE